MSIKIRRGTIEELVRVHNLIPEFIHKTEIEELNKRLNVKSALILLAEVEDKVVGFKAGYATSKKVFYSWIGGVLPKYRRKGIAEKLLLEMEKILKKKRYKTLTYKTRNKYYPMIFFGAKNGFSIVNFEKKESVLENRIFFEKKL